MREAVVPFVQGIAFLGGAGLLTAGFQLLMAVGQVRRAVLLLPFSALLLRNVDREVRRRIRTVTGRIIEEESVDPAEFVTAVASGLGPDASWRDVLTTAHDTSQKAARRSGLLLLDRLSYPEEVTSLRRFLRQVRDETESRARFQPAGSATSLHRDQQDGEDPGSSPSFGTSFASFVSALSGAHVIEDASDGRARVFDQVAVLHRSEREIHDSCRWSNLLAVSDYDAPVLDLRVARRVGHPTSSGFTLFLETAGSCYAATEAGDIAPEVVDGGSANRWGCKHLRPRTTTGAGSGFRFHRRVDSSWGKDQGAKSLALVTSYVMIRTSDDKVVLAKRSDRTRNGRDVLSASAGGVVEFTSGRGDRTPFGWPDITGCAVREAREELGVELDSPAVRPTCLFLSNSTGPTPSGDLEGQVVATVMHLGASTATSEELHVAARTRADPAAGAFEVKHLQHVSIGETPELLARWLAAHATDLDQHALIGLAYVMLSRFGEAATVDAILESFQARPWWMATPSNGRHRVCYSPGDLWPVGTERGLAAHSGTWAESWATARHGMHEAGLSGADLIRRERSTFRS